MTAPARPRFGRWRLSSRIAAFSLLLLLLLQLAGIAAIEASIRYNARAQLDKRLEIGERTWRRLLDQRAATLKQGAVVLAADFPFRESVGTQDIATIVSVLDNHGRRIDAALTALLATDLSVRATGESTDAALLPVLNRLAPQLAKQGSVLAAGGDRAYQLVIVPMRAPILVGYVVMGFVLDKSVADDILKVSGVHGTLVLEAAGAPRRVLLSSLPPALSAAEVAAGPADGALQLGGAHHRVRTALLSNEAAQDLALRLTGSLDEAIAPYRGLRYALVGLTALGLALFGIGSVWTARRVTRPLSDLAEASARLGRGDYQASLQHLDRADEVGDLAKAFDHMRVNIAAQQTEIRQLAYWDRLTGLPNRVQFRDAVRSAIEAAQQALPAGHVAVLMLDLDRFKNVNDALGYASGDALLKGVAARLQDIARAGDLVARLGGDEFALLMPKADAPQAVTLAERLAQAFERPLLVDEQAIDLSAGVGIACWPEHAADADGLLSRAEVAMYAAKARTAGAQVYDPAGDTSRATNLSLLSELRRAIEQQELRLYLQPKVHLASGRAGAAEALLRWQHPERGLVPPAQFIPFAEQTGFIRRLTLWIFEEVARAQAGLQRLGVQRVSVNLSTRDLLDHELPDKLEALLRRHGAAADGFCLEITESAIMDDPERAEATLNRLSERGFKLSIDDFGTGYSSLAYLKRLPVDELKIDKSFVMAMEGGAGDAKIVRSTIDLAHNLGLTVVAEGVENAAIVEQLAVLRCDEVQGYHFSKPLAVADFEAWVRRWAARAQPAGAASIER